MQDGNGKVDMSERRSAERKREQREKYRVAGFKIKQFYVHEDDDERVIKYIRRLRVNRLGSEEE